MVATEIRYIYKLDLKSKLTSIFFSLQTYIPEEYKERSLLHSEENTIIHLNRNMIIYILLARVFPLWVYPSATINGWREI